MRLQGGSVWVHKFCGLSGWIKGRIWVVGRGIGSENCNKIRVAVLDTRQKLTAFGFSLEWKMVI